MPQTNLYTVTIPPMLRSLSALTGMLDKLAEHAANKATPHQPAQMHEAALLQSRLVFDQFPFVRQVQIACDNAKGVAARLAGIEMPKFDDTESTVAELKLRISKTIEFVQSVTPDEVIGKEDVSVSLPYWNGKHLSGAEYVTEYAMANFYFHVTTAYAILRANGVPLGKSDFIGTLSLKQ